MPARSQGVTAADAVRRTVTNAALPVPTPRASSSRVHGQPGSPVTSSHRAPWARSYVPSIVLSDAASAVLAAGVAFVARFGREATARELVVHLIAALVLPLAWGTAMLLARAYEPRFLGVGSEEYRRVMSAGFGLTAAIGLLAYSFALDLARGYVVIVLPLAMITTIGSRYLLRKRLHSARVRGETESTVVVVGHATSVRSLVQQIHSARYHGMRVVAACTPDGRDDAALLDLGVDVRGDFDEICDVVRHVGADAVAVLTCPELNGARLRKLGWDLEKTDAELLVAPAVMEAVGPRISIHPVCGLPLLHVQRPEFVGIRRVAKQTIDRSLSLLALIALSPLLLAVAVAIASESRGGVLFKQERVGKDGRRFTMYKFRTMISGADHQVEELRAADDGNGVLFKVRSDPRTTRVGRVLRRYSLDELPQLINVLRGDMSLVGPRPPLQGEVEHYHDDMHRRFKVKPGLTGLWQINGRSDLNWDETVRLDLRYVENWSFAFDLMILWKTAGAVIRGRGAY